MTEKKRICIVVASRANYARIKSVMQELKKTEDTLLQVVVTASALLEKYGRVLDLITADGFEVDAKAHVMLEGSSPVTMARSTGLAIQELSLIFEMLRPDVVVTVADRYETLATAVAASYMNICLAHTQGGEVTGSIDESVRHAITKLSHIHLVTTQLSRNRVIQLGENPEHVHVTGCPALDLLKNLPENLSQKKFYSYSGVGAQLDISKPFLLVIQHPVTTEYEDTAVQINETIMAIHDLKMQTIWLWPNIDAGSDEISQALRTFRESESPTYLRLHKNFSAEDYAALLNMTSCIIGNSSSALREGALLGTPAVNIGTRQSFRERGKNVIDVAANRREIIAAIKYQLANGRYMSDPLYGDGRSARRIVEILRNYQKVPIQKKFFDCSFNPV